MSGLPEGAFTTTINGKQCTAIPRRAPPDPKPTEDPGRGDQPSSPPRPEEPSTVTSDPPKPSNPPEEDKPPGNPGRPGNGNGNGNGNNSPGRGGKGPDRGPPSAAPPEEKTTRSSKPPTTQPPPPPPETAAPLPPPPPPAETTSSQPPSSTPSESASSRSESSSTSIESIAPAPAPSTPSASSPATTPTALPVLAPSSDLSSIPSSLVPSLQPSVVPSAEPSAPPVLPTTADADRGSQPTTLGNGLVTTIGLDDTTGRGSGSNGPDRENSSGQNGDSGTSLLDSSNGMPSRGVIIGSTIGAAAAIGLIALLLWLWRKRSLKKRRSTLLTPLTMPPIMEKAGVYEFDNDSVGPTPRSEKLAAAMTNNFRNIGKVFGGNNGGVNANTAPYMDEPGSRGPPTMGAGILTAKDRYRDWWSRLGEDAKFNWRVRHEQFGVSSRYPNLTRNQDNQQDFRGLVDISEQEAQRRRSRGSSHGSANSRDHFLGALNVDLHNSSSFDPFSDLNALPGQPRRSLHGGPNSFSFDASGVQLPASTVHPANSYVAEVQRSRGRTMSGSGGSRPQSTTSSSARSVYRSHQSFDSLAARRNKFRSDPFDLEIESRSLPSDSDLAQMPNLKSDKRPSLTLGQTMTSKYTSGVSSVSSSGSIRSVSTGEWSDPGPDVGPAVTKRADSTASRGENKSGRSRKTGDIGMAM